MSILARVILVIVLVGVLLILRKKRLKESSRVRYVAAKAMSRRNLG